MPLMQRAMRFHICAGVPYILLLNQSHAVSAVKGVWRFDDTATFQAEAKSGNEFQASGDELKSVSDFSPQGYSHAMIFHEAVKIALCHFRVIWSCSSPKQTEII
jgi:hypothetical protein